MKLYTLYIGLAKVDTLQQRASAIASLEEVLLHRFGGYSHSIVSGGWRDGGLTYRESSLRVELVSDLPEQRARHCGDLSPRPASTRSRCWSR
jgi:hypothetical protein